MFRAASLLALVLASMSLSGCVAAVIPLAAVGLIGKSELDRRREAGLIANADVVPDSAGIVTAVDTVGSAESNLAIGTGEFDLDEVAPASLEEAASIDAAAIPIGAYGDWAKFALSAQDRLNAGQDIASAVLVPRVSLVSPQAIPCEDKPAAVIIDLDVGSDADTQAIDDTMQLSGDMRQLSQALDKLRESKIAVIWLSARGAGEAAALQKELRQRGLLPIGAEDFLSLNRGPDDRKQLRRWETAELFCILAAAGDARGDFDELYDYLLKPEYAIALERNFGNGWFVIANGSGGDSNTASLENVGKQPQDTAVSKRSTFFQMTPPTKPIAKAEAQISAAEPEKED